MKKLIFIIIALLVAIILIGCIENNSEEYSNGYYYNVESFKLDIGIDYEQLKIFLHKEQLHLIALEVDKNTLNSYIHLLTVDADGSNVQEIYRTLLDESVDFFHIHGFEKDDEGYITLISTDSVILPPYTREDFIDGIRDYERSNVYVCRRLSPNGEVLSTFGIDALNNDERQIIVSDVAFDLTGNAVISGVWLTEGTIGQSYFLYNNGLSGDFYELEDTRLSSGLFNRTNDGQIIVPGYAVNQSTALVLYYEIDFTNVAITEGLVIESDTIISYIGGVFPASEESMFDFYFVCNNRELFGYSKSNESITPLVDFLVFGIPLTREGDRNNVLVWDDGRIVVVDWNWNGILARDEATLFLLTPSNEPFISTREIITIGGVNVSRSRLLMDQIGQFNRQSETHRIEVIDYSYDYIDRLRTELMAGRGPDMIMLSWFGVDLVPSLSEGNFMLDLYQMIDEDSDMNREDFFGSVLSSWENSRGELIQISPEFIIQTIIGMQSVFPNAPENWSYADFIVFYQEAIAAGYEYPLGQAIDRILILELLLFADDTFFCEKTAVSNFDSKAFIDVLNFIMTIPADQGWENVSHLAMEGAWDPVGNLLRGEQLLLPFENIRNLPLFRAYQERLGGITAFGFPSKNSPTHAVQPGTRAVGIRSNSPYIDAAWEFVRMSLLPDTSHDENSFPLRIDVFEKLIYDELNRTERAGVSWIGGYLEYCELPESDADLLRELILNIGHTPINEHPVQNIVNEDVQAFFSGVRSAEDTARIIQSRVQIFLSERER